MAMAGAPASVAPNAAARRPDLLRWKRRSRVIRALRIALPAAIALIFLSLAGFVGYQAVAGGRAKGEQANAPIRLVNPRFVGRDAKGRGFVVTAVSAVRDDADYQRVLLDRPSLVLDGQGERPTRISARSGIYHEGTRKLQLQGGVKLEGAQQAFATASSLFDTSTGELSGSGPIQGAGALGDINAKSYGVLDKGERMIFKGGVRARIPTD
jgi:lipopolysaccharide export system protein LptC